MDLGAGIPDGSCQCFAGCEMESKTRGINRIGRLGRLQRGKGGHAECEAAHGRRLLYAEEAFGSAFVQRGELGFDVYGCGAGIARIYGMGLADARTAFAGGECASYSTVFSLLREAAPDAEIGNICEWAGIRYVVDTLALSYDKHITEKPQNPATARCAVEYIRKAHPTLVNIVFDEPDHVGHSVGHDTPEYYEKLHELDGYIGQIIQAVDEAGMTDETIFIVTADHGGIKKGHGGKTMEEMETAFIIAGKGIKKGYEFEESMMQFDCAATIAYIFGLEQPQVWIGRPMKQVFK